MAENHYPATQAQKATGDWNPFWDTLAELDPDYLERFLAFRAVPQNGPLPQKYKELIFIAINVATTHLWPSERADIFKTLWKPGQAKKKFLR